MMQANSVGGDMPQYDNSWGSTTRSKDNEASERYNDPREGGHAIVCNSRGSTTRLKVNETCGRFGALGEGGYASACDLQGSTTKLKNEWSLWKVHYYYLGYLMW